MTQNKYDPDSPANTGEGYINRSANKDADFFDVDFIHDPIPKGEFKDFNHNANASSVAPKLSTELDSSQKTKIQMIPRPKPNRTVPKDNRSEKHSKNNDVFNRITKIFQRKPAKKRPRSANNHGQYSDGAVSMKYRYSNDTDNDTDSTKEHSFKGRSYLIPPTEKKKETIQENANSDSEVRMKDSLLTPKKPTDGVPIEIEEEVEEDSNDSNESDKIVSIKKYLNELSEKSQSRKTFRYNLIPNSIDDMFAVGNDQLSSIFECSKHNFDMREINKSKSQLTVQTKRTTESLHQTTEKVEGLQTKFNEIKNQIHQTYENIDSTQHKADLIKARVKNLVDKIEIPTEIVDTSKSDAIKINEGLFDTNNIVYDYFPQEMNEEEEKEEEKEKPHQNILVSVMVNVYSFIVFIFHSIVSYFETIKKDFDTSSNKKKKSSKGKKKSNHKQKNKMIKIVKVNNDEP